MYQPTHSIFKQNVNHVRLGNEGNPAGTKCCVFSIKKRTARPALTRCLNKNEKYKYFLSMSTDRPKCFDLLYSPDKEHFTRISMTLTRISCRQYEWRTLVIMEISIVMRVKEFGYLIGQLWMLWVLWNEEENMNEDNSTVKGNPRSNLARWGIYALVLLVFFC